MEIVISQKKISVKDRFQIFTGEQPTYRASSKIFRWSSEINLYKNAGDTPVLAIRKKFSWLRARYDIIRGGESVLRFRTISNMKFYFQCDSDKDHYEIYGHKGRRVSIFKNGQQVAWWNKDEITWFAGDNYKIIADKDCDEELLIAFCLIYDNLYSSEHNGNTVTVDWGNIGFQLKKFDDSWQPKI